MAEEEAMVDMEEEASAAASAEVCHHVVALQRLVTQQGGLKMTYTTF